jgi:hypothetical protein
MADPTSNMPSSIAWESLIAFSGRPADDGEGNVLVSNRIECGFRHKMFAR